MGSPRLSLRVDEYIHPSIFHSGISATQEIAPMWDILHTEDNSDAEFTPLGGA